MSLVHLQYDVAILLQFVDVTVQSSLAHLPRVARDEGKDLFPAELVFLLKLDPLRGYLGWFNLKDIEGAFFAPHHESEKFPYLRLLPQRATSRFRIEVVQNSKCGLPDFVKLVMN